MMRASLGRTFDVTIYGETVGGLYHRGRTTAFLFDERYIDSPNRPTLSLRLEEDLQTAQYGSDRLPSWFENLLPEGHFRTLVASALPEGSERSGAAEQLALIARLGHDLPGAVRVVPAAQTSRALEHLTTPPSDASADGSIDRSSLRFSVAGIGLKLSMSSEGGRFVVPGALASGRWLVKFPDRTFPSLPSVEFATMELARAVGIDVPRTQLVDRDGMSRTPDSWWAGEHTAYAIERFDRREDGTRIHIEDMAQIRGVRPDRKYEGNLETVASLFYRRHDEASLAEFARRAAFNLAIGNSDAHLKNWSVRYLEPRHATISPAYDLVAVSAFDGLNVDTRMALRFGNRRHPDSVDIRTFERMQRKIGASLDLASIADDTWARMTQHWHIFDESISERDRREAVGKYSAQALRRLRPG